MAAKGKDGKLNDRQARFVEEYLIDLNGTQAAIRSGYSPRTANEQSARLLAKASVKAEIELRQEKRSKKVEITAERVLRELALLSFANMEDYIRITSQGDAFVDLSNLDRDKAAAIQEVTVEDYTEGRGEDKRDIRKVKFKLSDKRGSLELLGKHLGIFEPSVTGRKDRLEELLRAKKQIS